MWVHHSLSILKNCRTAHMEPEVPDGSEETPEELLAKLWGDGMKHHAQKAFVVLLSDFLEEQNRLCIGIDFYTLAQQTQQHPTWIHLQTN